MGDESGFLQAILANPQDNGVRLVYADWLEEQGEPTARTKAEFLRLTAQVMEGHRGKRRARRRRLQQLAADLDVDWLAVVSRLAIENCAEKRQAQRRYPLHF